MLDCCGYNMTDIRWFASHPCRDGAVCPPDADMPPCIQIITAGHYIAEIFDLHTYSFIMYFAYTVLFAVTVHV